MLLLLGGCESLFPLEPPVFDLADCPAVFAGKPHSYVDGPLKWPTAEGTCEGLDDNPDDSVHTHLVTINSLAELSQLQVPAGAVAWVGLNNAERGTTTSPPDPDEFDWITAEPGIAVPWSSNSPDSNNLPTFARIEEEDGLLHDSVSETGDAGTPVDAICECDAFPALAARAGP